MLTAAKTVANFEPTGIISNILDVITQINAQYNQMQENIEICEKLKNKIDIINQIILDINKNKQTDSYQKTLKELEICLKQCLEFIGLINVKKDMLGKIKDFLSANSNKEIITNLTIQLHTISDILHLALSAQTSNNVQEAIALITAMTRKQTEKIPVIEESNQQTEQLINNFVSEVNRMKQDNVRQQAEAGRDIFTTTGGIRGQGSVTVGGGDIGAHTISSSQFITNTEVQMNNLDILKKLKAFFRDEEYEGDQSVEFDIYNRVLEHHRAELGYKKKQQKHTLYVNDESLEPKDAIKAITKMMESLQANSPDVLNVTDKPDIVGGTNIVRDNVNLQAQAGRDIFTTTGGISGNGPIRLGGGDTYNTRTYTPSYSSTHNKNAPKFSIGSISGPTQVGDKNTQTNTIHRMN